MRNAPHRSNSDQQAAIAENLASKREKMAGNRAPAIFNFQPISGSMRLSCRRRSGVGRRR
jgi:hypothetical protein